MVKPDNIVKSPISDGFEKSSRSRRGLFRFVRRTYVRRSKHEMKRNADIGLFAEPSKFIISGELYQLATIKSGDGGRHQGNCKNRNIDQSAG